MYGIKPIDEFSIKSQDFDIFPNRKEIMKIGDCNLFFGNIFFDPQANILYYINNQPQDITQKLSFQVQIEQIQYFAIIDQNTILTFTQQYPQPLKFHNQQQEYIDNFAQCLEQQGCKQIIFNNKSIFL